MVIQPNSIGPPPLWKTSCAPRMYQAKSQESGLRKVFNYWIRLVGSRQNFKTICQSSNDFDQYDLQFWLRTTSHLCSIWGKFDSSRLWVCFFWFVSYPLCYEKHMTYWRFKLFLALLLLWWMRAAQKCLEIEILSMNHSQSYRWNESCGRILQRKKYDTVDGRNPAPPGMYKTM